MDNNELKLAKREQNISLIKTALKCIMIVLIIKEIVANRNP